MYSSAHTVRLKHIISFLQIHLHYSPSSSPGEEGRNVTAITNPVFPVCGTTAATQLTFRLKAAASTDTPHIKQCSVWKQSARRLSFDFTLSPATPFLLQDSWLKEIVFLSAFLISILTRRREIESQSITTILFSVYKSVHVVYVSKLKIYIFVHFLLM